MAALEFIASKHPDQLGDYVGKVISKSWESLSSGFGNDQIDAVAILDLMGAIVRGRRPISKDACQFDEFALHQEPFSIDALLIFGKFEMMRLSGLPQSLEMAAITQLVQNVDGCWPFAKVVVMSDRPELMVWNADMKLHCEIGPAIQFRDGREEFYLYHERVSELAVRKPETITVNDIDSEPKNQKRRVKVARYKVGTPIRGGGKRPFKHDD